jgi:hypothetical protein
MLIYFILIIGHTTNDYFFDLRPPVTYSAHATIPFNDYGTRLKDSGPGIVPFQFKGGGHPPKELNPVILMPYLTVMNEEQCRRCR